MQSPIPSRNAKDINLHTYKPRLRTMYKSIGTEIPLRSSHVHLPRSLHFLGRQQPVLLRLPRHELLGLVAIHVGFVRQLLVGPLFRQFDRTGGGVHFAGGSQRRGRWRRWVAVFRAALSLGEHEDPHSDETA